MCEGDECISTRNAPSKDKVINKKITQYIKTKKGGKLTSGECGDATHGRDGHERIVVLLEAVIAVVKVRSRLELRLREDESRRVHGRVLPRLAAGLDGQGGGGDDDGGGGLLPRSPRIAAFVVGIIRSRPPPAFGDVVVRDNIANPPLVGAGGRRGRRRGGDDDACRLRRKRGVDDVGVQSGHDARGLPLVESALLEGQHAA